MQWTCQLVVKTGTPPERELTVLLQGGVNLFQGEVLWLDKPLPKGTFLDCRNSLCVIIGERLLPRFHLSSSCKPGERLGRKVCRHGHCWQWQHVGNKFVRCSGVWHAACLRYIYVAADKFQTCLYDLRRPAMNQVKACLYFHFSCHVSDKTDLKSRSLLHCQ